MTIVLDGQGREHSGLENVVEEAGEANIWCRRRQGGRICSLIPRGLCGGLSRGFSGQVGRMQVLR